VKISCPTCSAKYSIADEKVQNRLAKIRCRKCGTAIVIDGNVSPAHVYAAEGGGSAADADLGGSSAAAAPAAVSIGYAPAASAPAASPTYTVDLGENDQRQMTVQQLVDAYNTGAVTADTYVWTDGFADWTPLGQVDSIVAALHAAAAATGPSAPVVDEASATGASTHVDEKPWNSGPFRGAAAAPGPGGADLFGGVSDAGNESDGVSVGTAANPFSGATTGARNESSVLFSLSALTSGTGSSRSSAPPPSAANTSSDDSGLIDLKALTAMAQAAPAIPMAPAPVAAVSPFGAAPLGGLPSHAPSYGGAKGSIPAPKRNNTGLIIGISIIIAAVAVAAIVTFGGSEEQPIAPPAPALTSAPIAAPAPAPAPEPTPAATAAESDAKPPATGAAESETAPGSKKKTATSTKPRPTSGPSPSAAGPSPSPAPAPKPKSSGGGKCGCRSDDLMCLMNCAK